MKFGVIIFPGSNCDHDAYWTVEQVLKQPVTFLWHESHELENCDAVIVPGGFAYGDYLRTGAIARFSPVMESVRKFADGGGLVMGICTEGEVLTIPIGHMEGNYFCDTATLDELRRDRRVLLRYSSLSGEITAAAN